MFVIFLYFNSCDHEIDQHLLIQKHLLLSKTLLGLFLDPTKKIVTRPSLQLIHTNSCHITFHQSALTITSSSCLLLKVSLPPHHYHHLSLVMSPPTSEAVTVMSTQYITVIIFSLVKSLCCLHQHHGTQSEVNI